MRAACSTASAASAKVVAMVVTSWELIGYGST
jgi:hypothetical protein